MLLVHEYEESQATSLSPDIQNSESPFPSAVFIDPGTEQKNIMNNLSGQYQPIICTQAAHRHFAAQRGGHTRVTV